MKRKMLLLTLAVPLMLCSKAQAQVSSRLIAQVHLSNSGAFFAPNDSTSYSYSTSTRGGDLKHTLKYDNAANFVYVGDTQYVSNYVYYQTFDANNNLLTTTSLYWSGTTWVNWVKTVYTYNTSNQVTSMISQNWGGSTWMNVSEDVYNYNTANQLFSDQYEVWNSLTSTFDPASQKIYYYDGSGNKIQEVDQSYDAVSTLYTYTNRISYVFSSTTNNLISTTYSSWNGASWSDNNKYTNTYDTLGDVTTLLYSIYDSTTSAWNNSILHVYSNFTSSKLPQTEIDQTWDTTGGGTWVNNIQYTYTYNSFNQMTSSIGESWNVGVGWEFAAGDPEANYYYGTYNPTNASVQNVVANGGDAAIYPVPAQNTLNIDLNWTVAQAATISIFDMSGREIKTWSVPAAKTSTTSTSVSDFAAGIYLVKINGTEGQIVKQVVVAH